MPSTLERLKERKVVQWGLAYLAVAFVAMQVVDLLAEPFSISAQAQRVLYVVAAGGFFAALVLAWYHGEKGQQRVSGPELLILALLLVMTGGVLRVVQPLSRETTSGESGRTADSASETSDQRPAVAVLPFADHSPSEGDAYFAPSMHDEVISRLGQISGLRVVPRASVMRYQAGSLGISGVADELGVGFVLDGTAQITAGRARLRVTLISVRDEEQLWELAFDRPFSVDSLVDLQAEIATEVAHSLRVIVTPEESARLGASPSNDIEAYRSYLAGRIAWSTRRGNRLPEAIEHFERAIALDSLFARAFAALADAYVVLPFYSASPELTSREVWARAKAAADRAVYLDETLSDAHVAMGGVKMYFDWDWAGAEEAYLRALDLDPSSPWAHHWYGWLLSCIGRSGEAISHLDRARRLDPFSGVVNRNLGDALLRAGDYEEALAQYQVVDALEPGRGTSGLISTYRAIGELERVLELGSTGPEAVRALVDLGRTPEARALVASRRDPTLRQRLSDALAMRDAEWSLRLLDEAFEAREPWLINVRASTTYDFLRSNERYQQFLDRMGFPRPR